jgi:hypothetical protein
VALPSAPYQTLLVSQINKSSVASPELCTEYADVELFYYLSNIVIVARQCSTQCKAIFPAHLLNVEEEIIV